MASMDAELTPCLPENPMTESAIISKGGIDAVLQPVASDEQTTSANAVAKSPVVCCPIGFVGWCMMW